MAKDWLLIVRDSTGTELYEDAAIEPASIPRVGEHISIPENGDESMFVKNVMWNYDASDVIVKVEHLD
jgi:hypothetical protein